MVQTWVGGMEGAIGALKSVGHNCGPAGSYLVTVSQYNGKRLTSGWGEMRRLMCGQPKGAKIIHRQVVQHKVVTDS